MSVYLSISLAVCLSMLFTWLTVAIVVWQQIYFPYCQTLEVGMLGVVAITSSPSSRARAISTHCKSLRRSTLLPVVYIASCVNTHELLEKNKKEISYGRNDRLDVSIGFLKDCSFCKQLLGYKIESTQVKVWSYTPAAVSCCWWKSWGGRHMQMSCNRLCFLMPRLWRERQERGSLVDRDIQVFVRMRESMRQDKYRGETWIIPLSLLQSQWAGSMAHRNTHTFSTYLRG